MIPAANSLPGRAPCNERTRSILAQCVRSPKEKKPHVTVEVVIEEGQTATAPVTPQGFTVVTATATCSEGVALVGGFRTSSPSGFGVEANDSYASSSTEWTVRALAQEAGVTLTVRVTC